MSVLRESFGALGFSDVVTYIQSGKGVTIRNWNTTTRLLTML
ncbi:hypothetical protein LuPra_05258 [Luteitalea pratensis]|uniref:Uncharacterized protein n=1 Tax=Luteitalea pratensis TaxID=1855912 RepID=A0A143PUJ6_LUTPR|nr:hypothetical protein LuPra_05258 [Luteitalea pratensis]